MYMNYFIYTSHHFTPHGRYELNKLASLPMCGFIAQLVEHRTGIAKAVVRCVNRRCHENYSTYVVT